MHKLTAILFLDLSGDIGTKKNIKTDQLHQGLMFLINQYNGEPLKQTNNELLAIFESAVLAVKFANEIKQSLSEEYNLQPCIGIHIGDLHTEDGNVYGSGIEIASKICQEAPEGCVYISGRVFRSRRFQQELTDHPELAATRAGKIASEDGEQSLPIYDIAIHSKSTTETGQDAQSQRFLTLPKILLILGVLLLTGYGGWWLLTPEPSNNPRPSVAVLPFEDFSEEGNYQWFSDGLTEEVINSLVRLDELYIPSRTSSFAFKNQNIPIKKIADSLNVEHIVEGSVRRSDERMRIAVQLIEAEHGGHLWSKTYDRSTDSIFAVQKDIAKQIVSQLDVYLDEEKRRRMFSFGTKNVKAYEAFLKGENIYYKAHQKGDLSQIWVANKWYNKAIELDSTFAFAYQQRSDAYYHFLAGQVSSPNERLSSKEAYNRIVSNFNKSIRYSNNSANRLFYRFTKSYFTGNWDQIPELVRKIHDNRDAYQSFVLTGGSNFPTGFIGVGHASLARELYNKKLNQDPLNGLYKFYDILALLSLDKAGKALRIYKDHLSETPLLRLRVLVFDGKLDKARSLVTRLDSTKDYSRTLKFYKLILGLEEMSKKELDSYFDENDSPAFKKLVSFSAGYPELANRYASRIDTMLSGCKKLTPVGLGGLLLFDLEATPNLARCYEKAGIETEPHTLAGHEVRRIVQKDL